MSGMGGSSTTMGGMSGMGGSSTTMGGMSGMGGMGMGGMDGMSGMGEGWGDISDVPWGGILVNEEPLLQLTDKLYGKGTGSPKFVEDIVSGVPGKPTRLRIICATANQMLVVSVPGVKLTVVAIDGQPIEPFPDVSSIQCSAGARIDALLPADATVRRDAALLVRSVDGESAAIATTSSDTDALAAEFVTSVTREERRMWTKAGVCDSDVSKFDNTCIGEMYERGLKGAAASVSAFPSSEPQKTFRLTFGGSMADPYVWTINSVEFAFPFPSLYSSGGTSGVPVEVTGNAAPQQRGTQILEVAVGDVVDFVLDNSATMMYHPFHLHGYHFWVLGAGEGTPPESPPEPEAPVRKDTQNVPANGWAWIRIKADSPGWWVFHCHIDFHMATGMFLVVKVGSTAEINAHNPLPSGFLQCPERKP